MELITTKERMQGKEISREQLEAEGWKFTVCFAPNLLVFRKGETRITWNPDTLTVEEEYNSSEQKI